MARRHLPRHSRASGNTRILVLGQTPPPHHGQAMMIEKLVTARMDNLEIFHVRLGFSLTQQSVGRVEVGKVLQIPAVLARAIRLRLRRKIHVLYFSPAGPHLVPVLRDLLLLPLLRPFFAKTIFHFHAAGLSEFLRSQPRLLRALARVAYGHPAGAIQTSGLNPADGEFFGAGSVVVIANGLEDAAQPYLASDRRREGKVRILFVGSVVESKGVMVLLAAGRELAQRRDDFTIWFMGPFASKQMEAQAKDYCRNQGLGDVVTFIGERLDTAKWDYFRQSDILCFPSHYECESFGNVAVEAMMFGLPVVATRWRGIPDVVEDGKTGLLVPIRDPSALAGALESLIQDADLRRLLGCNGRKKYLEQFTIARHLELMEQFLCAVARER